MAGITVYAATKIFCRFVYQGWNYDHADKFDVLSYEPGSVKSGLNPTASMLPEFAAAGALRDLGSQDVSGGVISQKLQRELFEIFYNWMPGQFPKLMYGFSKTLLEKRTKSES